MNPDIQVTFDPPTYRGWTLGYSGDNGHHEFHARSADGDYAVGQTLRELRHSIDAHMQELEEFDPPVQAAYQRWEGKGWEDVEFFARRGGKVFFRRISDGETNAEFLSNLADENSHSTRKFRLKTANYDDLFAKVEKAVAANQRAYKKVCDLKRGFQHVTAAVLESSPIKKGGAE